MLSLYKMSFFHFIFPICLKIMNVFELYKNDKLLIWVKLFIFENLPVFKKSYLYMRRKLLDYHFSHQCNKLLISF